MATFFCAFPLSPPFPLPFQDDGTPELPRRPSKGGFVCYPEHFFGSGAGNVPWGCVWRGMGVPLSWREGEAFGI